jgi:hypothetical protein
MAIQNFIMKRQLKYYCVFFSFKDTRKVGKENIY